MVVGIICPGLHRAYFEAFVSKSQRNIGVYNEVGAKNDLMQKTVIMTGFAKEVRLAKRNQLFKAEC